MMKFLAIAMLSVTAAVAEEAYTTLIPKPSPTAVPQGRFRLKTQQTSHGNVSGSLNADGLYVYPFSKSPYTYSAQLTSDKWRAPTVQARHGHIGGVKGPEYFQILFNINTTYPDPGRSFLLQPVTSVDYTARWQPVNIASGLPVPSSSSAFFLENGTIQWTDEAGFYRPSSFFGWIVCEWWHPNDDNTTEPGLQLFFRSSSVSKQLPSTCADINLVPEN